MLAGIDIGGTKCAVSLGTVEDGAVTIVEKQRIDTPKGGDPYRVLEQLAQLLRGMGRRISAIGISCGGPLDSKRGLILSPPNLPGWDNVGAVDYFQRAFCVPVALQNDANAGALAEWQFGAGKGCDSLVFLTFGTGMGAGLILNGRLYTGACDMAGEIGHVRLSHTGPVGYGKEGSFEGFCSGGGIAQLAQTKARALLQQGAPPAWCPTVEALPAVNAKLVAEFAQRGDEAAAQVYQTCGERLGMGLSILIDVLNPQRIVLGSVYARSGALLQRGMERVLARECLAANRQACRIVPAALGEQLGDYAALAVAAHREE